MTKEQFTEQIPDIPEGLRRACRARELVIFVGAGTSMLHGAPSWAQLADVLLDDLYKKRHLTYAEIRQFRGLDPKKKLSLAKIISRSKSHRFDFKTILHRTNDKPKPSIFADIASIGAPIVTTNYDEWLDCEMEERNRQVSKKGSPSSPNPCVFWKPEDLTVDKLLVSESVVHLHGSVREYDSMVISTSDYFEHYSKDYVKHFLTNLFGRFIVLFIGYSLEETEILEFIFRMSQVKNPDQTGFWLYPCCSYEIEVVKHISGYYRDLFNIQLIPYYIDKVGYDRLGNVIENWSPLLNKERGRPSFLKEVQFLDEALK